MKEAVLNIIDKLNIQVLLLGTWIISIIGVFVPNDFFKYIGLLEVKTKYQWIISVIFLFLGAYYLALLIRWGYSQISSVLEKRKMNKYFPKILRELSDDEKRLLVECFYRDDEKKFGLEANLNIRSATVNVLASKKIISSGAQIGDLVRGFSFYIQPGAYEELNKMLKKGEIKIGEKNIEWYTYEK